jgi:hypothetical protein
MVPSPKPGGDKLDRLLHSRQNDNFHCQFLVLELKKFTQVVLTRKDSTLLQHRL